MVKGNAFRWPVRRSGAIRAAAATLLDNIANDLYAPWAELAVAGLQMCDLPQSLLRRCAGRQV